jgi:hypothetical protein
MGVVRVRVTFPTLESYTNKVAMVPLGRVAPDATVTVPLTVAWLT